MTTKLLDFEDWKYLIHLNEIKHFKTIQGRNEMLSISQGMNSGRVLNYNDINFDSNFNSDVDT